MESSETMVEGIERSSTNKTLVFPTHSLLSEDGIKSSWDFVSNRISDYENVPFSLDNKLRWRSCSTDEWTCLGNRDDVTRQIMNLIRCKAGQISTGDGPKELVFAVSIKKEVLLTQLEFEATEETVRRLDEAVYRYIFRPPRGSSSSEHALMERAIRQLSEQAAARAKTIRASKSSIEALEDETYFDDKTATTTSCPICMENIVIGCQVTRMPRSHKFHKSCILSWLQRSHVCPLCRYKLSTT